MQPDSFIISMDDGADILVRHHPRAGATRLYISHGNGFAVDGYKVFWEPLLEQFDVVLFDMRNHGRNDPTGADGHTYQQMARDLTTVHKKVEARLGAASKAVGVFHSMTSRAAMKNAVELGSPYDALVLYDPPSVPPRGHALYEAMRGFELKLVQWASERPDRFTDPAELEAQYAAARASAKWLPQARADMARAVTRKAADGGYTLACARELEASIYLAALTLDLWPDAQSLGVPTKLIGADPQGNGGPPTGPANNALASEGGYDYVGVENVGHLLQIEQPETCRNILTDFVSSL
ncbi:alpha/beta hydrolase [Tepidamorphus sp. 3E244]|uniref:alpha/beta hydrolase n=1 Tax=Tepidamorphus sp. 3E244 TaxID=3385498 RepID=UPI0038FC5BC6